MEGLILVTAIALFIVVWLVKRAIGFAFRVVVVLGVLGLFVGIFK